MEELNKIIVSGIINTEPTGEVKSRNGSTHGVLSFRITNPVQLSETLTKENIFYVSLYIKDCVDVAKQYKIGDRVWVDGRVFSSGGGKSYMNIKADKIGQLSNSQVLVITPETAIKMSEEELMKGAI